MRGTRSGTRTQPNATPAPMTNAKYRRAACKFRLVIIGVASGTAKSAASRVREQTNNLLQDLGRSPKQVIVDLDYRGVDADNPGVQIIHRGK